MSLILAQFGAPTPPALPGGPLWERLLLESPWPLAAALAAGAVIALFVLNGRGQTRAGLLAAGALAALGAGVVVLARTVQTDGEAIRARTEALVGMVARVDEAGMDKLLASDARLLSSFEQGDIRTPPVGLDKAGIIARVRETLGRQFPIREHAVLETQGQIVSEGLGRTQVRVRVVVEGWNFPHTSWWRLDWRRDGGGWRAVTITPVAIDGLGSAPR